MRLTALAAVVSPLLGTAALAQGVGLPVTGRVVDEQRRPLAGVEVYEGDDGDSFAGEPVARTGADGAFEVAWRESAGPRSLLLRQAGRASRRIPLRPVPIGEVVLGPGQRISGVVRDASGVPLAGVRVVATDMLVTRRFLTRREERECGVPGEAREVAVSDAHGIFALRGALAQAGTLQLSRDGFAPSVLEPVAAHTPLDVVLAAAGTARSAEPAPQDHRHLAVRAVDRATHTPVRAFRAQLVRAVATAADPTLLWEQFRRPRSQKGEVVLLPFPASPAAGELHLLVAADGYASRIVDRLPSLQDPAPGIAVELEPEARLSGVLHNAASGEPLAGFAVWAAKTSIEARQRHEAEVTRTGRAAAARWPVGRATTDAGGRFELRGLAPGETDLYAHHPALGYLPVMTVVLKSGEHREGFELAVPLFRVRGQLTGAPVGRGWLVRLAPVAYLSRPRAVRERDYGAAVPVGEDGCFEFPMVLGGRWSLELVCPLPPRTGRPQKVAIQQLVVKDDIDRFFRIEGPVTARVQGRVELRQGDVPLERLIVVSEPVVASADPGPPKLRLGGTYTTVGVDGRFELVSPTGNRHLLVLDAQTGVVLGRTAEPIAVHEGASSPVRLACRAFPVDVELPRDRASDVRLELRPDREHFPWGIGSIREDPRAPNVDLGMGLAVPVGPSVVRVYVPPGQTELRARVGPGRVAAVKDVWPAAKGVTRVVIDLP